MVRFTVKYSQVNSYVVVLYNYDSTSISTWAMKNLTKESMTQRYKELHENLVFRLLCPQIKILDNEASKLLL